MLLGQCVTHQTITLLSWRLLLLLLRSRGGGSCIHSAHTLAHTRDVKWHGQRRGTDRKSDDRSTDAQRVEPKGRRGHHGSHDEDRRRHDHRQPASKLICSECECLVRLAHDDADSDADASADDDD